VGADLVEPVPIVTRGVTRGIFVSLRPAVAQIGSFLSILFCHLPKGIGDLGSLGYTRLPRTNAGKLNQISERVHLPSRRLLGRVSTHRISMSQNWDSLCSINQKST
jgi:hypothetical protein